MSIEDRQRSLEIEFTHSLQDALEESHKNITKFKKLFESLQKTHPDIGISSHGFQNLRVMASAFVKQKKWNQTKRQEIETVADEILKPMTPTGGQKRKREEIADEQESPQAKKARKAPDVAEIEIARRPSVPQRTTSVWTDFTRVPALILKTTGKHLWKQKFSFIGRGIQAAGAAAGVLAVAATPVPPAALSWGAVSATLLGAGHKIAQLNPPSQPEIPIAFADQELRQELLGKLELELNVRVKGQEYAKQEVLSTLRTNLSGAGRKTSCLGCFFFAGPTGVGKTELAKTCSSILFGSEEAILFLQGGQYTREGDEKALIGSAPGYIGHDPKGGTLTKHLRDHPYSIVVFDEIEKATPDVRKLFLGLLDGRGSLKDFQGEELPCKNTIFIFTSNYGADFLSQPQVQKIGPVKAAEQLKKFMIDHGVAPEFIGRLQKVLPFFPLSVAEKREIVAKELNEMNQRERFSSLTLSCDEAVIRHLTTAFNSQFGIRALQQEIDKIGELLSNAMDTSKIQPGDTVRLFIENSRLLYST